ncbi:MAG: aldo/keto reductase [Bacteroidota bacterium]|jgi:aryl-alcohol dehydrogenase-like predicted oxidoreductase
MKYRPFGKTGINVSEIGYGAWGIGGAMWQGATDEESMRALHKAIDMGVNFVDTALVYGDGHSEGLVGRLVRERKERIYVATKVPPKNGQWPARKGVDLNETFPHDYIIKKTEQSLKNLNLDFVDILQFHVWDDEWTDQAEWSDAISKLKEEGKIRHFGVSINDHQPENALKLAASGKVDTFQVIYNIFDQSPEDKLFPLCKEKNIGVIVRVPLDEGGLGGSITADTVFPDGDFRNNYFKGDRKKQIVDRVSKLMQISGTEAQSIAELALRFVLSHPAVSTVIPGMRSTKNVDANCGLSDGKLLSVKLLSELKKHRWVRDFYH